MAAEFLPAQERAADEAAADLGGAHGVAAGHSPGAVDPVDRVAHDEEDAHVEAAILEQRPDLGPVRRAQQAVVGGEVAHHLDRGQRRRGRGNSARSSRDPRSALGRRDSSQAARPSRRGGRRWPACPRAWRAAGRDALGGRDASCGSPRGNARRRHASPCGCRAAPRACRADSPKARWCRPSGTRCRAAVAWSRSSVPPIARPRARRRAGRRSHSLHHNVHYAAFGASAPTAADQPAELVIGLDQVVVGADGDHPPLLEQEDAVAVAAPCSADARS